MEKQRAYHSERERANKDTRTKRAKCVHSTSGQTSTSYAPSRHEGPLSQTDVFSFTHCMTSPRRLGTCSACQCRSYRRGSFGSLSTIDTPWTSPSGGCRARQSSVLGIFLSRCFWGFGSEYACVCACARTTHKNIHPSVRVLISVGMLLTSGLPRPATAISHRRCPTPGTYHAAHPAWFRVQRSAPSRRTSVLCESRSLLAAFRTVGESQSRKADVIWNVRYFLNPKPKLGESQSREADVIFSA